MEPERRRDVGLGENTGNIRSYNQGRRGQSRAASMKQEQDAMKKEPRAKRSSQKLKTEFP